MDDMGISVSAECMDGSGCIDVTELPEEMDVVRLLQLIALCLYACYGLALCCDEYFVSALEILVERLALPPDVAGATFMAAVAVGETVILLTLSLHHY